MEYPPRCKHGWMSSCLEGCEDAYKGRDWSDDDRMIDEMVDEVLMDGLMEGLDDVSS